MTNAAENRKWGKNKWEFGGVRSGRKEEGTPHTSQERPVEGRATSRNQKSQCPLTGWDSPRKCVRRGAGKLLFGPAVGIVRSKQTVLSSRMSGEEEQKGKV